MAYYNRRVPAGRVSAKTQTTYPMVDIIAAACVAFHAQGDKIEKYDVTAQPAKVYDDYTVPAIVGVKANKTLALAVLEAGTLTQADRDEAEVVIQHCQGMVTMALLSGKQVSSFVKTLVEALELPEAPEYKLGLLVYAPNVHHTSLVKEAIVEQTVECLYTSQPLGVVDAKVAFNFTLIEKRFVQQLGCYSAYGKDDAGNLVTFLTKHEEICESGVRIGKIKKVGNDSWHGNAIVTALNYVKAA